MKRQPLIMRVFVIVAAMGSGIGICDWGIADPATDPATRMAAESAEKSFTSGYETVNGLRMYYEIHGEGEPLVLLHGAYLTIGLNFGKLLPALAERRQVIVVELQGHGRTEDIDRPLSCEQMADGAAALLRRLGIARADILGYSMGGTTAVEIGIRHPRLVRRTEGVRPGICRQDSRGAPVDPGSGVAHAGRLRRGAAVEAGHGARP